MKKCIIASGILGILLMTLAAGCNATVSKAPIRVSVVEAKAQDIQQNIELTGILVPAYSADLTSQLSGQIETVKASIGDWVNAGDVLVTLDSEQLEVQRAQAQAGLVSAEAGKKAAVYQINELKSDYDLELKDFDRTRSLYEEGAVSKKDLETAEKDLQDAEQAYEKATGPSLDQAEASVLTAQANIQSLDVQLKHAEIKSPLTGVITNCSVIPGETVNQGSSLMKVADTQTLILRSTVSQDLLPWIKAGDEIDVQVDVYPDFICQGTVEKIGPLAVSTGTVFPIEIVIDNEGDLLAGMSAHGYVSVEENANLVVPDSAIIHSEGETAIFVEKEGVVYRRKVATGLSSQGYTVIISGIEKGEHVVTSHIDMMQEGMAVTVQ